MRRTRSEALRHVCTYRHLGFFQYQAYPHARVPRVQCPQDYGVKKVGVPWARGLVVA